MRMVVKSAEGTYEEPFNGLWNQIDKTMFPIHLVVRQTLGAWQGMDS